MIIKAIETWYAGCRFRSRLEARWAVFFDALGVEWDYEPEGLALEDGTRYLPDFWLPQLRVWFEVKGPNGDRAKWNALHDALRVPGFHWHDPRATAERAFERILATSRQAVAETPHDELKNRPHDHESCPACARTTARAETLQREVARQELPDRALLAGRIPRISDVANQCDFGFMTGPGDPHSGWAWGVCVVCGEVDACHVAWPVPLMCGHESDDPRVDEARIKAAYIAARSARFEHGESG